MKKFFLTLAFSVLIGTSGAAQQVVNPCVKENGTPFSSCSPVSATNPLPVTLAAGSNLNNGVVTAAGTTASRTLTARFGDHYNVKDWGAVCDGSTDDTAAFNAAGLQASTDMAGTGKIAFIDHKGICVVCGAIIYRNTLWNNVAGEILVKNHCASTPPVASENYSSLVGTGAVCGTNPNVPSWFGWKNEHINCNAANNASGGDYTGECFGFYGPRQIMLGDSLVRDAASDPAGKIEDSNSSTNSAQCQEEGYFESLTIRGAPGKGLVVHGPHNSHWLRFVGSRNGSWSWYAENGANFNGGIDWMGNIHTYSTTDFQGQYWGVGGRVGAMYSDGDNITIASPGAGLGHLQVGSVKQLFCGNGGIDCLTVSGNNTLIEQIHAETRSNASGISVLNNSGGQVAINTAWIYDNSSAANTGIENSGANVQINNIVAQGFTSAGDVCLNNNSSNNTYMGKLIGCDTGVAFTSGGINNYNLLISNSGGTLFTGSAAATDNVNFKYAGTSSGGLNISAPNVTAPAFVPTGSTIPTNGMYLSSANAVSIATNGAREVLINSSGQTILGGDASAAAVNSAGTIFPNLYINGNSSVATQPVGDITIQKWRADATGPVIWLGKSRSSTIGTQTVVQSGDSVGSIDFAGADGTTKESAAQIIAEVDGTPGNNDMPGRLRFLTTPDGSGTPVEAMRINNAGLITLPLISSDATHTDSTVCQDTTTHGLYFGSGTLGICLGTSSARYKRNITDMKEGLAQISRLRPVNFFYKKGHGDNGEKKQYGFLAEETIDIVPQLTGLDKEGKPNSVDILGLVPVLVKALQEQQTEIESLRQDLRRISKVR